MHKADNFTRSKLWSNISHRLVLKSFKNSYKAELSLNSFKKDYWKDQLNPIERTKTT